MLVMRESMRFTCSGTRLWASINVLVVRQLPLVGQLLLVG